MEGKSRLERLAKTPYLYVYAFKGGGKAVPSDEYKIDSSYNKLYHNSASEHPAAAWHPAPTPTGPHPDLNPLKLILDIYSRRQGPLGTVISRRRALLVPVATSASLCEKQKQKHVLSLIPRNVQASKPAAALAKTATKRPIHLRPVRSAPKKCMNPSLLTRYVTVRQLVAFGRVSGT